MSFETTPLSQLVMNQTVTGELRLKDCRPPYCTFPGMMSLCLHEPALFLFFWTLLWNSYFKRLFTQIKMSFQFHDIPQNKRANWIKQTTFPSSFADSFPLPSLHSRKEFPISFPPYPKESEIAQFFVAIASDSRHLEKRDVFESSAIMSKTERLYQLERPPFTSVSLIYWLFVVVSASCTGELKCMRVCTTKSKVYLFSDISFLISLTERLSCQIYTSCGSFKSLWTRGQHRYILVRLGALHCNWVTPHYPQYLWLVVDKVALQL